MGLHIHTLNSLPENVHRDYYVYLLDYGGKEDLVAALKNNFERMSKLAEKSNAIVIAGTDEHFQDEVFLGTISMAKMASNFFQQF